MKRVTGIGGVFLKAEDPKKLYQWYEKHLGIKPESDGIPIFRWREDQNPEKKGMTIFSFFPKDTKYFEPSRSPVMLNFRVENLDEVLKLLEKEGVEIDPKREDSEYGRFAWVMDPDGNRVELWEPPKSNPDCY